MTPVALLNPAAAGTTVTGLSGAQYAVDANGFVSVTTQGDIVLLLNAGFRFASVPPTSAPISAAGLIEQHLRLTDVVAPTGAGLGAAPAAGVFGFGITLGTSFGLLTEAANSNSKADSALLEFILPPNYIAGQNLSVIINTTITIGSGVLSVQTIGLNAYKGDKTGVLGTNICTTTPITIPANVATDNTFALNGAALIPGNRLLLSPTLTLTETSGHNVTATINSIRVK